MGSELKCRVRFGKQESEGKALLETNEIIFRGDLRLKIPFAAMQSMKVVNGELQVRTADGLAKFELGAETAAKWLEKILHPKSRIEKLGLKAGAKVALVGFEKEDQGFVEEIGEQTSAVTKITKAEVPADVEWIFLKADTSKELVQLSRIAKGMRGAAALWIVYPKGRTEITERDVLKAGRAAALKDVKVVGFSATHSALKFVIPVSQR
jgi:hypothetical protein